MRWRAHRKRVLRPIARPRRWSESLQGGGERTGVGASRPPPPAPGSGKPSPGAASAARYRRGEHRPRPRSDRASESERGRVAVYLLGSTGYPVEPSRYTATRPRSLSLARSLRGRGRCSPRLYLAALAAPGDGLPEPGAGGGGRLAPTPVRSPPPWRLSLQRRGRAIGRSTRLR